MAFDALFAVFALSMVVIAVLAVRWAVGRDRDERARRDAADEHPARPAGPG